MAQRRMFSMKVIDTDAFCEMPASAQNLYFQIGMRADDEGFYAGVLGLMAKIHASKDDLNVLIARRYILDRGEGVYVVKHWRMNNYLQNDRIKPTEYDEKRVGLFIKKDGSYTLDPAKSAIPVKVEKPMYTKNQQNVYIDKNRVDLVESSLGIDETKGSIEENYTNPSLDKDNQKPTEENKTYAYTGEEIAASDVVAEECLTMKARRESGVRLPPEWENTLNDFGEIIQKYEDDKPW